MSDIVKRGQTAADDIVIEYRPGAWQPLPSH